MRKKNIISGFIAKYFDPKLDLRVQMFSLLAVAGIATGFIIAIVSLLIGAGILHSALNLFASAAGFFLLYFVRRTGRYRIGFLTAVILVFIILFPVLFFSAGGYKSGMPSFFVFAIVFTALMLEGRDRTLFVAAEFAIYAACCLIAYFIPESVVQFASETDAFIDILIGFIAVAFILLIVVLLYIRIYDNRRMQSEERYRKLLARGDASEGCAVPRDPSSPGLSCPAAFSDYGLTARETDVARLLIEGKQRKEIAEILYVSIGTVNTHCGNIYKKTACSSPVGLIRLFGASDR